MELFSQMIYQNDFNCNDEVFHAAEGPKNGSSSDQIWMVSPTCQEGNGTRVRKTGYGKPLHIWRLMKHHRRRTKLVRDRLNRCIHILLLCAVIIVISVIISKYDAQFVTSQNRNHQPHVFIFPLYF